MAVDYQATIQPPVSTKGKALMPKSKRKIDLAPSTLAKCLAIMADKSSAKVVQELASIYQLTPEERRSKTNVVRGMRAAQRELCSEFASIWRICPHCERRKIPELARGRSRRSKRPRFRRIRLTRQLSFVFAFADDITDLFYEL